jgi:hypothetical protein
MKPIVIALSGAGRESRGGSMVGSSQNESPLYNEYTLIKMKEKNVVLFVAAAALLAARARTLRLPSTFLILILG